MEFLNDHLAWKQNDTEPPFGEIKLGKWYWMKAEISDKGFTGKIWEDGEDEPKDWLLESKLDFGNVRPGERSSRTPMAVASRGAPALTIVSFDNWAICETADECTPDESPCCSSDWQTSNGIWGALKARY